MCKVIAVCNQKGGVAKTTTTVNLGIGLAGEGQRVLLIDNDAQGSLTASLGIQDPDSLDYTLATVMGKIINGEELKPELGIIQHHEGIDLMPGNIELSGMELTLVGVMRREFILAEYVERVRDKYDWILIDCGPSLGMVTINALAAADSVLIPVQVAYLPAKGLELLVKTVRKVINQKINPDLKIEGILLTMAVERTNYAKEIIRLIEEGYGNKVRIFEKMIPYTVRVGECPAFGESIYKHEPKGKAAKAYRSLTMEIMDGGEQR